MHIMRTIQYKTHWSVVNPPQDHEGSLLDFVLDVPGLLGQNGAIPPWVVLNQVLQTGGTDGGLMPGTTWTPFSIPLEEYGELVHALMNLDMSKFDHYAHPYIWFRKAFIDEELKDAVDFVEWLERYTEKYGLH